MADFSDFFTQHTKHPQVFSVKISAF